MSQQWWFPTYTSSAPDEGSRMVYAARIDHERSLASAYLGVMLDDLCRRWGLDPVKAWRLPKLLGRKP